MCLGQDCALGLIGAVLEGGLGLQLQVAEGLLGGAAIPTDLIGHLDLAAGHLEDHR